MIGITIAEDIPLADIPAQASPDNLAMTVTPVLPDAQEYKSGHQEIVTAWSSVDGKLDVISVRRQPYFVIDEHLSTNQVRCTFPDDWMPIVKDLLGHRVVAEGLVRYRPDGTISSLSEPISIQPVPEPRRTIAELRGTLPGISGNLSSVDYIRQIRTGEGSA